MGGVAQLGERRVRNAEVGSSILLLSTKYKRPTVLGWAFFFVHSPHHAGLRAVLRVPGSVYRGHESGPFSLFFALSSPKICANLCTLAHAKSLAHQALMRVSMGTVEQRTYSSKAPVKPRAMPHQPFGGNGSLP